ncbi:dipeptide ABC transporter ATP-binding protein [Agromyces atrinae]|uniref:ABC transporter ATP-binding protein n=1 Tax=Agromyces atrinae TaxID=592376 RepID=A0A4Q2M6D7_9MICO|nr:ABC transporter ATP-binding protein [Agromyces atrinae]NYD68088.1 peptide/nickel transport system ATP-binding protein [Agromyces atrinae]RXZ87764.1 ABC transporter ATP-binding protein [Agromyces atrinae]
MLLSVTDLDVSFDTGDGRLHAVRGISFELDRGQTLGVVGESGSGKSVSTQAMVGLSGGAIVSGSAVFQGRDLLTMGEADLRSVRGKEIGMVFQDPLSSLHPQFRIGAQIAEAIRVHEKSSPKLLRSRVVDVLAEVGIPNPEKRIDDYPHQFSGGMRQRVMIGLALALRPALLVADEPTTALDVTVQAQLLELMNDLQREHGTAILMITHDLGVVAGVADRVMTMYGGRIVERGSRADVLVRPHHPYTRGLLASVPRVGSQRTVLQSIPGNPPSLLVEQPGCPFASRCALVHDACLDGFPDEKQIGAGHRSACVLPASEAGPVILPVHAPVAAVAAAERDLLARIDDVRITFDGARKGALGLKKDTVVAVDGVSLDIPRGGTLGIVGESGSGKSTLARALTGLIPLSGGTVEFEGRDISSLRRDERRALRRDVQMVFQDPYGSLNQQRRVGSIIADPLVIHDAAGPQGLRARVQELMELVGLNPEHYNRFPAEFSGGQRQRIGIARALALNPKLIVCDEPVSALDVSIQAQILNLLGSLQSELGLTYVFIAHDLAVVEHIADTVAVMYRGKVVEYGTVDEIYSSPREEYTRTLLAAAPHVDTASAAESRFTPREASA